MKTDYVSGEVQWQGKALVYLEVDPLGATWTGLGEALNHIKNRPELEGFNYAHQVLWLRNLCVSRGLAREDRLTGPDHVDTEEFYQGLALK